MHNIFKGRLFLVRMCLLASTLLLVTIGIVTIYGVGNPAEAGPDSSTASLAGYWKKQLLFFAISAVGFAAANLINYRRLGAVSHWIYASVVVLLAYLLVSRYVVELPFAPPSRNNVHRWLVLHPRLPRIQPSEFCKLAYILTLAWYLRYRSNYRRLGALVGPFVLTLLPMAMILAEPDLGTVMLMMPVFFAMLFVAGAKVKHLALIVVVAVALSPVMWLKMRPYQRTRISSVLLQSEWIRHKAEQSDLLGRVLVGGKFSEGKWRRDWGYHIIRSKYAVASGGGLGRGYRRGPFVKYSFLPERHNDFVFSAIAHQWGFAGSLVLLALYTAVFACGLEIAANNTDPFGRLLAIGIVAMFAVELLINVGMTLGLMPITGLTLPFVSYGGSSLLVSMTAVGLLHNVGRSRPFTVAPKA